MDLLEFEELRRSETTDKLPFLVERKHTHTHKSLIGQSKALEVMKQVERVRLKFSGDRQKRPQSDLAADNSKH